MEKRYQTLTSPLSVRGKVLKSRFIYPVAQPHFMQANELYPASPTIEYFANRAQNGVSMIWLQDCTDMAQRDMPLDVGHFNMYDIDDKGAQNGIAHFVSHMHTYGTLVCPEINLGRRMFLACNDPEWHVEMPRSLPAANTDPSVMIDRFGNRIPTSLNFAKNTQMGFEEITKFDEGSENAKKAPPKQRYMTREVMDEYIAKTIAHCKKWAALGVDGGYLDLSHNFPIGQFLRACVNHRTDEYGGSLENRMRFPLEVIRKVREAMGPKWILSINSPVIDGDSCGDGMTLDEMVVFMTEAQKYVDILHLRRRNPDHKKEQNYMSEGAVYSKYLKDHGITCKIAISTPYKDLDKLEEIVREGYADIIAPGHLFISNNHLGEYLKEGNGEDMNPCIECHACRGTNSAGEWVSSCTVNPEMGLEYRMNYFDKPITKKKRVAVIGGGPGGVVCAIYLKKRGHEPVIFEKTDEIGGEIKMAKYPTFKWELLRYLDWLKSQVVRKQIEVRYHTEATPEMIEAEGFDAVVAAVGGTAKKPDIPGAEYAKWNPINIYGHESEVGHKVVVVGGASSAVEAASYLSECGHEVEELCRKEAVGYDTNPIRYIPYMNILANTSGVLVHYEAKTLEIGDGYVVYRDKEGNEHRIECDDVVASGGMQPSHELAFSFSSCAKEFYVIGDCKQNGNMRNALRDAFGAAMQI